MYFYKFVPLCFCLLLFWCHQVGSDPQPFLWGFVVVFPLLLCSGCPWCVLICVCMKFRRSWKLCVVVSVLQDCSLAAIALCSSTCYLNSFFIMIYNVCCNFFGFCCGFSVCLSVFFSHASPFYGFVWWFRLLLFLFFHSRSLFRTSCWSLWDAVCNCLWEGNECPILFEWFSCFWDNMFICIPFSGLIVVLFSVFVFIPLFFFFLTSFCCFL